MGDGVEATDGLIITCKYTNELPKPPVQRFLHALPTADRLCRFQPKVMEKMHKPQMQMEREILSLFDFNDAEAYGVLPEKGSMPPPLPPHDAALLRDDDLAEGAMAGDKKRRKMSQPSEAWYREAFPLQNPQLLTNDIYTERQRFTTGTFSSEKKLIREPPKRLSSDDFAAKVEETFEVAASQPPVHPLKPELKPKRILPIVPDAMLWSNRYRQVSFDEPPKIQQRSDLLFKTTPHPRYTTFGYFSTGFEGPDSGSYKLVKNYVWSNRGAFGREVAHGEGETVLLSIPPEDDGEGGEARFIILPPRMTLKKQEAVRLDIKAETRALNIQQRDTSEQEAEDEQRKMQVVLGDSDAVSLPDSGATSERE